MLFTKYFKKLKSNKHTITINYPTSANNKPRWGYDLPPHPILAEILERKHDNYIELFNKFCDYQENYRKIPIEENVHNASEPFLANSWLPGLDSLALYCLMPIYQPAKYIEIGSGNSTKFARRTIKDHNLNTELISIDPQPRAEIDALCDRVIRKAVELVDIDIFENLEANDILFIDNSHRCFMNSDATVIFLDIIPRLKPGVLVEIHDIFLPYDYPPHWIKRYYSEQYLLAAFLLADGQKFDVLLPNAFVTRNSSLHKYIKPFFAKLEGVSHGGGSFWFVMK